MIRNLVWVHWTGGRELRDRVKVVEWLVDRFPDLSLSLAVVAVVNVTLSGTETAEGTLHVVPVADLRAVVTMDYEKALRRSVR